MSLIEESRHDGSSEGFKDSESVPQFYGGMIYKQNENKSVYHYGNTSGATVVDEDGQVDHWEQLRLIREKCINLYKKYT